MPKFYIKEASDLLGIHPDTLRRWVEEGKISAECTTGEHRRYDVSKLLGTSERDGKTVCTWTCEYSTSKRRLAPSVACVGGEELSVEVVIINHDINASPDQELVQDVLEVITVFSASLDGESDHQNKSLMKELDKSAKKNFKLM